MLAAQPRLLTGTHLTARSGIRLPEGSRVIGFWALAIVGCLVCTVVASALANSGVFLLIAVASAVAVIAATAIGVLHHREWDALCPLGLIALFFIATFVVGGAYGYFTPWPGGPQPYQPDNIIGAIGLAAIGLPMLVLGYWTNAFRAVGTMLPRLPAIASTERWLYLLGLLLGVGWIARLYMIASGRYFYNDIGVGVTTGASWLLVTIASLPLLATAYAGATYYFAKRRQGDGARRAQLVYYGLLTVEVLYSLPRGSRAAILTIMMMVVVLRYYGLRRRPSLPALTSLVLVGVLVVFPFLYTYRNSGERGTSYHQDFWGNFEATATGLFTQSPTDAWDSGISATLGRFAGTQMVASMLHQGPDAIQRRPGETLSWTLTGLVPRAVYPTKPDPGNFAHEFASSLAVTAPRDTRTSVTVTPVAEFYFNYRITGLIIGMFVLGGVYRVIGEYFAGRHSEAASLAVYAASAWPLINAQEAIVSGGVVGIIKGMAVLTVVLFASLGLRQLAARRRASPL